MTTIALVGAGGKMGNRLADNLRNSNYDMLYVEISEKGIRQLAQKNLTVTPLLDAVNQADVIILAVPDIAIGEISADIVPQMKPGSLLMLLDPAAAYMRHLPDREDISYFITHPCHPPIYNDEVTPEAKADLFGGVAARQSIVCALMQGPESDYAKGEEIARRMYSPILRSHRITVEQMATLEPTMAETVLGTCIVVLKEAMDEAVKCGVPPEAARDFMLGHITTIMASVFGITGSPLSDAALVAIEYGKKQILQPNWRDVFSTEKLNETIDLMLHPSKLETTI
ncbi:NAD(P)-binding domain-containing protein [Fodinisporobacter ferrooxydans]|uniref:NAD(P)-binding domain-containing protein n=1 Tax=Fodinisporobacter ferrooxydans TaxID=2901836 RepID=A0ABY4CL98_9BACL|nr:NAD(P)-binding domain-containing protein [Alicyclobacillaceae bacterium MYW30-H2]